MEQISVNNFKSYEEFWQSQEPQLLPHTKRAEELGLNFGVDGIPVSPVLTILRDAVTRIENMFSYYDLAEAGIDIKAMLTYMTEQEVVEELEALGIEPAIGFAEVEALIHSTEWHEIMELPEIKRNYFNLRQFEEVTPGCFVDVSAFNTVDYLRNASQFEIDKYRYFTDKTAEKATDLAILHSCLTTDEGRKAVRQMFINLVNSKYRNYALKLVEFYNSTSDLLKREEIKLKVSELNRQIVRLRSIWKAYAFKW